MTDALSLFLPMFNEEKNIEQAVRASLEALAGLAARYEVILVDDGSTDRTGEMADRLSAADPRVRVVHHRENGGYGAALRSGFAAARYSLVVFLDGDLQFDPRDIRLLLDALNGFDAVSGYRVIRRDPAIRRLNAWLYNRAARVLFGIRVRDVNCACKLYRRELVELLLPELRSNGALINVEMLARARKHGARITEVGVQHYPRRAGSQTGGSAAVIVRAFLEMLDLARELR